MAEAFASTGRAWALVGGVVDEDPVDAVAVEVEEAQLLPPARAHVHPHLLLQVLRRREQIVRLRAVQIPVADNYRSALQVQVQVRTLDC